MTDESGRSVPVSQIAPPGQRRSRAPLLVAYAIYVPLAVVLVIMTRWHLNVDGVAYIRIAKYYAEGNTDLAVTGYWSPLLSWLIVPVHFVGGDALLAGPVINAAAGLLPIAGVWRLTRLFKVTGPVAKALPTATGLLVLSWLGWGVYADPLVAALLTWYFVCNFSMCRTLRLRHAVAAGAVAGVCYLAKYYALPFFILHHFLSVLLVAKRHGRWLPGRRHVACYAVGMLTCAAVAAPWIGVLSVKYGKPTFATTGRVVHGLAAPHVLKGPWSPLYRLADPRPGRVTVWENPDEIEFGWPQWSPLGSSGEMLHQLRLFFRNGRAMARLFFEADSFGLIYACLLVMPIMAALPRRNILAADRRPWRWALLVIACYLSGFMFVFADSRRYYWPLQGLLLVLVGLIAVIISRRVLARGDYHGRLGGRWEVVLAAVIVLTCLVHNAETIRHAASRPGADLVELAQALRDRNVSGPFVTNKWHETVQLAYYMNTSCAGTPAPQSAAELKEQLRQVNARNLLVFTSGHTPTAAANVESVAAEITKPSVTVQAGRFEVSVYPVRRILHAKKPHPDPDSRPFSIRGQESVMPASMIAVAGDGFWDTRQMPEGRMP